MKLITRSSFRPVLIATAASALPLLIVVSLSVIDSFIPPAPGKIDPDPGMILEILFFFSILLVVAVFLTALLLSVAGQLIKHTRRQHDLRRMGKRFGWRPEAIQPAE
jgi:hypothetical protein